MNELIIAVLAVIGGTLGGAVAQWLRGRADERIAARAGNTDTNRAELESDAQFMDRLIRRVEILESKLEEVGKVARLTDIKLERVCNAYEDNRKLLRRVSRQLRAGETIHDGVMQEMEEAPPIRLVLVGTFEEAPSTPPLSGPPTE